VKKIKDKSKKQTSISVDAKLWEAFRIALIRRLHETQVSRGVEIAIEEWLKRNADNGDNPRDNPRPRGQLKILREG
jgi:hypothetical protein